MLFLSNMYISCALSNLWVKLFNLENMEKYVSVDQGFEGERDNYVIYWQTLLLFETMFFGDNNTG